MGEKYVGNGQYHLKTCDFISIYVKSDKRDKYNSLIEEEISILAKQIGIENQ